VGVEDRGVQMRGKEKRRNSDIEDGASTVNEELEAKSGFKNQSTEFERTWSQDFPSTIFSSNSRNLSKGLMSSDVNNQSSKCIRSLSFILSN
jgi:hypothetical protein